MIKSVPNEKIMIGMIGNGPNMIRNYKKMFKIILKIIFKYRLKGKNEKNERTILKQ